MSDDVAARASDPQRLRRLAAATAELLVADSHEAVAKVVTDHLTEAAGAAIGSLSLALDDTTLTMVGITGVQDSVRRRWATFPVSGTNPAAEAFRTRRRVLVSGLDEIRRRYPDLEMASEGERTLLALPLLVGGDRCVGVLNLSFAGRRDLDETERIFLRLLADTCAAAIDRVDAQRAVADRQTELSLLADAASSLAGDLDLESTLRAVAQAAVPSFADWCAISLAEDGRLRTIAVAHNRPELDDTVRLLQERYPASPEDTGGPYAVLRTGRSVLVPDVTDEMLAHGAKDEEHLRLIRLLEARSAMSCPLTVHERVLGVVTWVAGEHGRRFGPADLGVGEEIARRAAVAIDNAQLHSQVRDVALELQEAVLPAALPQPPGWGVAVRYLPAGRTDAGGDFYGLVPLGDRFALFVGDVMGRGVAAAAVMAQMRSTLRALVALDDRPDAVMAHLDRVFDVLQVEQLVTAVYAVVGDDGRTEVVSAGHPPALVVRADSSVELLRPQATFLLGAGGGERSVLETVVAPGEVLVLHTDGLTERPGEDADVSTARLVSALRDLRGDDLDGWLDRVVAAVRDPRRDDDVAVVLVRRDASG